MTNEQLSKYLKVEVEAMRDELPSAFCDMVLEAAKRLHPHPNWVASPRKPSKLQEMLDAGCGPAINMHGKSHLK